MLKGRLGLDRSDVRHDSRQGLVHLQMGVLSADRGNLVFTATDRSLSIPAQTISAILLGPGGSVAQDALRLMIFYGLLTMKTNKDLPGNIELRYAGSSRRKIVTLDDILCVEKAV